MGNMQPIQIATVLPTGTAFAVTAGDPAEVVFVPGRVVNDMPLAPGITVMALLVRNTSQPDRAPWLAAKLSFEGVDPKNVMARYEQHDLDAVLAYLKRGGLHQHSEVYAALTKHFGASAKSFELVGGILNKLYHQGHCVRIYIEHAQTDAKQVWFTCFPDHITIGYDADKKGTK